MAVLGYGSGAVVELERVRLGAREGRPRAALGIEPPLRALVAHDGTLGVVAMEAVHVAEDEVLEPDRLPQLGDVGGIGVAGREVLQVMQVCVLLHDEPLRITFAELREGLRPRVERAPRLGECPVARVHAGPATLGDEALGIGERGVELRRPAAILPGIDGTCGVQPVELGARASPGFRVVHGKQRPDGSVVKLRTGSRAREVGDEVGDRGEIVTVLSEAHVGECVRQEARRADAGGARSGTRRLPSAGAPDPASPGSSSGTP